MSQALGKRLAVLSITLVLSSAMLHGQESSTKMLASLDPAVSSSRSAFAIVTQPPTAAHRVADRPFWMLVAFTAGSAVMDGETTMRGLGTGRTHEINPLLGPHPSRARFYATTGATDTALALLSWQFKRSGHDKLWKLPLLGATTVHLGGAMNNLRY